MAKLTKAQKRHMVRIAAALHEHPDLPAGWMNSKSEQVLERLGLVRHWTEERPFGGGGAIGAIKIIWNFAELTDEGWVEVSEILKET